MVKALKPKTVTFSDEGKFKLQTISTISLSLIFLYVQASSTFINGGFITKLKDNKQHAS